MDDSGDLFQLAALLEQAYRLALDVQDDLASTGAGSCRVAVELVDVLDDARVSLFKASRSGASGGSAAAQPLNARPMTRQIEQGTRAIPIALFEGALAGDTFDPLQTAATGRPRDFAGSTDT